MTTTDPHPPPAPQGRIESRLIEREMRESYLTYALSVIHARALPDVRDGLKPSQRRILVAMDDPEPRSARQVPQVRQDRGRHLGQLPPARRVGDLPDPRAPRAAVLDALSADRRPGQLREHRRRCAGGHALHGGAHDRRDGRDDGRSRQETVDRQPNYDETRTEPVVLPGRFPNLLCNGSGRHSRWGWRPASCGGPHNLGQT
jgi:DNA gyrase subunit A